MLYWLGQRYFIGQDRDVLLVRREMFYWSGQRCFIG